MNGGFPFEVLGLVLALAELIDGLCDFDRWGDRIACIGCGSLGLLRLEGIHFLRTFGHANGSEFPEKKLKGSVNAMRKEWVSAGDVRGCFDLGKQRIVSHRMRWGTK